MVTRGGGRWSRNSHHPSGHPPQRLVFRIDGFECSAPLVVSPLVEPAGHRPLQAVDLSFQSVLPVICNCLRSRFFRVSHPECRRLSEAVGRHAGDAWDVTLLELLERRRTSSQCMCRLPPHCAIPDRTEFVLPTELGSWPSQCA